MPITIAPTARWGGQRRGGRRLLRRCGSRRAQGKKPVDAAHHSLRAEAVTALTPSTFIERSRHSSQTGSGAARARGFVRPAETDDSAAGFHNPADTLFGATYMVVPPASGTLEKLRARIGNMDA